MVSQKVKSLQGIIVRNGGFSKTFFFVVCDDIWIAIYPLVVVIAIVQHATMLQLSEL
jgi:hypothetical protein